MRNLAISDPGDMSDEKYSHAVNELQAVLTPEQMRILNSIRARQMLRPDDMINIDSHGSDIIDGLSPNLVRGQLGLVEPDKAFKAATVNIGEKKDILALLTGEELSESSLHPKSDPGYQPVAHVGA